jgi:hypothetical protein
MSEGGWTPEGWEERAPAQPPERLPRLEDLPPAEHGYDRAAVQQAFEAFYRHAAQLDTTLRMLESMEIFARQAKDLREDIRALRASAWGPVPAPRPSWSAGTAERTYSRAGSGVPETLPRLAVEAAFIVLVAIGAAVAELDAWLIVVLVLGAFLLVAIFEVVASTRRARPRPGLLPSRVDAPAAPAPAPAAPEEVQPAVVAAAAEATMIEPGPEAVAPEPEPEPAVAPEPEPEVALEPEPEPVLPPAVSAVAAEDPWEDRAEIVQLEAAPEPAPEPEPMSGAGEDTMDVPVVQAVSEPAPTRFRRRRR